MLDTISMAAQLKGEYKAVFEKADMYGILENSVDAYIYDDKMMNLYDLLMQAQAEKTPVSKIIGEDIEEFCQSYFKEEAEQKTKWLAATKFIYRIAWLGVIVGLVELIWPEEESGSGVDIMPCIVGFLVGLSLVFLAWVAKKTVLKSKKLKPIVFYFLIIVVVVIGFVVAVATSVNIGIELRVKSGLLLILSGLYVAIYLVIRSVWRYRDHGTVGKYSKEESHCRKEEKEEKKAFNSDVSRRNVAQTAKTMKIRYKRLSRRYKKKHGEPMTLAQYKEKLNKERKWCDKLDVIYFVISALIILVPTINIMVTSGLTAGAFYGVIMVVVFFFIYRFQKWTDKISENVYNDMLYVLDLCITYDLDLDTVGEAIESGKITPDYTS